jgi:hypothetical protein
MRVILVRWPAVEHDLDNPHHEQALRMRDDVIITFVDGKCALYTAALLHAMFPNADELIRDMSDQD